MFNYQRTVTLRQATLIGFMATRNGWKVQEHEY